MEAERKKNIRRLYSKWRLSEAGAEWVEILRIKQSNVCWLCLIRLDERTHIDHIIPIYHGGTNNIKNLCLTHPICNLAKGTSIEMNMQEIKERRKYFSDLRRLKGDSMPIVSRNLFATLQ